MVQKESDNIKLEIILDLLKNKENHVRGLAKNLGVSHTTVLRKVGGMVKENVLDYKKEGKNKIFSLKRTLKAKNYVYMSENYKANKLLERYPELGIILKEVISKVGSNLIVLFGSYAKFTAKQDSDIDLFVETKDRLLKDEMKQVSNKINLKTGSFDVDNALIKEIIKNHVIIKGIETFYEKTEFFE